MKKNFHPETFNIEVSCVCGSRFNTISTLESIRVDICSQCHPLFTGAQKFIDTAGRIDKFAQRYGKMKK